MKPRHQLFVLWLAALFLGGCASATLTIDVDIYDEDPRLDPPMSPAEAGRMLTDLQNLETAAIRERNVRKTLAEGSFSTFAAAWRQAGGDEDVIKELEKRKDAYIDGFAGPVGDFERKLTKVRDLIEEYTVEYSKEYNEAKDKVAARGRRCKDPRGCTPSRTGGRKTTNLTNNQTNTASPDSGDDEIIRNLTRSLVDMENKIRRQLTGHWRLLGAARYRAGVFRELGGTRKPAYDAIRHCDVHK